MLKGIRILGVGEGEERGTGGRKGVGEDEGWLGYNPRSTPPLCGRGRGWSPPGHNVTEAGNLLQILGVAKILGWVGGGGGGMADNVIY